MRALAYFFSEAAASLWRGRAAALTAIGTIAVGLFVLGLFLMLTVNVRAFVERWRASAEMSVYLIDGVTPDQLRDIDRAADASGIAAGRRYVSKDEALARFKTDFPDMATAAGSLESNPFPASFELQVHPAIEPARLDDAAAALGALPGVADVRYDAQWIARLDAWTRGVRVVVLALVGILSIGAAFTVANVVRLAAAARSDEIDIMQLVGAPFVYVRGPFVAEGILQGGVGGVVALTALAVGYSLFRMRFAAITFLSPATAVLLVVGGMAVGCLGGYLAARQVR